MSDFTLGEIESVNAYFFGVDPMDIAHIAVFIQTKNGSIRSLGCQHVENFAALATHMRVVPQNDMADSSSNTGTHDDTNVYTSFRNTRKGRVANYLSYLQFRARIRYRTTRFGTRDDTQP